MEDSQAAGEILAELGAIDIYLLDGRVGEQLIEAREQAFWVAKAAS